MSIDLFNTSCYLFRQLANTYQIDIKKKKKSNSFQKFTNENFIINKTFYKVPKTLNLKRLKKVNKTQTEQLYLPNLKEKKSKRILTKRVS